MSASRIALVIATGLEHPSLEVCHNCDVRYSPGDISYRTCCNPGHLFWATHAENETDCAKKGRSARGERNGQRKLTKEQVADLVDEYGQLMWMLEDRFVSIRSVGGAATKILAKSYAITNGHLWSIRTGKAWKEAA